MTRTVAALLVLLLTCSTARADGDEHPPERLEALRRIIDMEDRRETAADAWRPLVLSDDVVVARRAIAAAGRTRAAGLAPLLRDAAAVEALGLDAAFALGLCPDPGSLDTLLALASADSVRVRAAALRSIGRLGDAAPVGALLLALRDPHDRVRRAALLALCQLRGRRAARRSFEPVAARELLARLRQLLDGSPSDRTYAAYALFELDLPDPERLGLLEASARGAGPEGRVFVARALAAGTGHEAQRLDTLLRLLDLPEPHGGAAAAASIARIGSACGDRLPTAVASLAAAARRRTGPSDFHVRRAAVAALAELARPGDAEAPDPVLLVRALPALREVLDDPSPSVRVEALTAAARLAVPSTEAVALVEARAEAERPLDRLAAARAARHLPAEARDALLERLRQDVDPRVACEALGALGELAGEGGAPALERLRTAARAAAAHEDMAVKTTGVSLLGEHGEAQDVATIAAVASRSGGSSNAEVRVECVSALEALGARDGAPAAQRDAAVAALRASMADPSAAVQVAAAKALTALTGDTVSVPDAPATRSTVELAPEDLLRGEDPRAVLQTTKGTIVLELLAREAPRHVKSFVALARSGFYDGLRFHRVVSGFVIQGLDPRGDGWGSGDVLVKDEINAFPYGSGTVGMPNAGPDTGGCQLFITHVPTPHLDGNYTVFGQVVEGMDVVHAIDLDDVVVSVEVRD